MLKTRVLPFEYEILKRIKGLENRRLLIALSGGRDSVVLLNVLSALRSRLNFDLRVAYVHHGRSSNREVSDYRKKAADLCKKLAASYDLEFHLLKHVGAELKSEADFRKAREVLLEDCRKKYECDFIAFAHHSDDLLETRLIRLIRGTGSQGLQAMNFEHGNKLRPLIHHSAAKLATYAVQQKLKWLDDPTNKDDRYLRNFIRNTWLAMLEQKRLGSAEALKRSLEQICESLSLQPAQAGHQAIKRKEFGVLSLIEKREVVARIMLERGARDFSRRQIDEILKRLSSHRAVNRRKMSFEVGGLEWRVNAEQIEAVRL